MRTECNREAMLFARLDRCDVVADFGGGAISSDAGALLLGATDRAVNLVGRFAACFTDGRAAERVVHDVRTLIGQRVFAIALGYEDLVDHDDLRHDPVLGPVLGRLEARRPDCAPLAGKSTLNRLEQAPVCNDRYRKIAHDPKAIENVFVDLFLDAHTRPPARITLDLDATDDPIHGRQEGRFFHGYYDCYCYLPLYVFCGEHLLAAKLRRANIDASAGAADEIARIVRHIRERWPRVRIRSAPTAALHAKSSWPGVRPTGSIIFSVWRAIPVWWTGSTLTWPGQRKRLSAPAGLPALRRLPLDHAGQLEPAPSGGGEGRVDAGPGRERRQPALCGHLACVGGPGRPDALRARLLRPRRHGKPDQRMPARPVRRPHHAATMAANQSRPWFASMAYVLLCALRRKGLAHTRLARATCGTLRLKLLKIGAQVTVTVRRIRVAMASACPYADEFALAHTRLCR